MKGFENFHYQKNVLETLVEGPLSLVPGDCALRGRGPGPVVLSYDRGGRASGPSVTPRLTLRTASCPLCFRTGAGTSPLSVHSGTFRVGPTQVLCSAPDSAEPPGDGYMLMPQPHFLPPVGGGLTKSGSPGKDRVLGGDCRSHGGCDDISSSQHEPRATPAPGRHTRRSRGLLRRAPVSGEQVTQVGRVTG